MEKSYVIVEWVDSAEANGWSNIDEALLDPPAAIQSVGILLQEPTEENPYYIICRDISLETHSICGVMRIPKEAVLRIEEYEWPKEYLKGYFE